MIEMVGNFNKTVSVGLLQSPALELVVVNCCCCSDI
jgi:hypothetical protein